MASWGAIRRRGRGAGLYSIFARRRLCSYLVFSWSSGEYFRPRLNILFRQAQAQASYVAGFPDLLVSYML